jgi:hypothetical protein
MFCYFCDKSYERKKGIPDVFFAEKNFYLPRACERTHA